MLMIAYLFVQPVQALVVNVVTVIEHCLHELQAWLRSHFLKCNNDENEVLVIGSWLQTIKIHIPQVMIGASEMRPQCSAQPKFVGDNCPQRMLRKDGAICVWGGTSMVALQPPLVQGLGCLELWSHNTF